MLFFRFQSQTLSGSLFAQYAKNFSRTRSFYHASIVYVTSASKSFCSTKKTPSAPTGGQNALTRGVLGPEYRLQAWRGLIGSYDQVLAY